MGQGVKWNPPSHASAFPPLFLGISSVDYGLSATSPPLPISALSPPHPLNNVLSILEAKEKDLRKHEIPEQSCLFLGELLTFLEGFGATHRKQQVIIISILLAIIFSYFSLRAVYSTIKISLFHSDDLCEYLYTY